MRVPLRHSTSNAQRPISPHLSIYQPQLTWVLSIGHRMTGCGLAAGIYAGGITYAIAPFASASVVTAAASAPVLLGLAKFLVNVPFTYHTFNGIRHLLWDARYFLTLDGVYYSGYAVLGSTVLSSLYLANM